MNIIETVDSYQVNVHGNKKFSYVCPANEKQIIMDLITPSQTLLDSITRWIVYERGYTVNGPDLGTYSKRKYPTPEKAAKKVRSKGFKGDLIVAGLTMHAETKPLFVLEDEV